MKFLSAISFLTVIKIPQKYCVRIEKYPEILVFFPVTGILIGVLSALVFGVFNLFLPLVLSFILMTGFEILLTGGIHIDGLADLFDGTFSGETDKKKIIEIMKKGNTGVFGVLAIVFSLVLKVAILYFTAKALLLPDFMLTGFGRAEFLNAAAMSYRGLAAILPVIVFAPVYGRLSMLLMFSVHEPANPESSLSTAFRDKSNREVFILSFIYISVLFVAVCMFSQVVLFNSVIVPAFATPSGSSAGQAGNSGFLLSRFLFAGPVYGSGSGTETGANLVVGPVSDLLIDHWTGFIFIFFALKAIIVIISTLLFTAAAGKFFARRLKGITGDVIGGVCVLTEIFFLFANYIAIRLL